MTFSRAQPDEVWLDSEYIPTTSDWFDLGRKVFRGINGVRGGAWNPKSAIVFPNDGLLVTGPLHVAYGGSFKADTYRLGGASWPQYAESHTLRQRTIVTPMLARRSSPRTDWVVHESTAGVQSLALGVQSDASRVLTPARMFLPLDVQDTSTIRSATFFFTVPIKRSAAPYAMPRFRLFATDEFGRTLTLASPATGADPLGYQSPPSTPSVEAWFADGRPQSFTYVCDQNNVVDVSTRQYFAEVIEEGVSPVPVPASLLDGVLLRERKLDVACATTATLAASALTGSLSIDGINPAVGERVLIKNGINNNAAGTAYLNGIWIVSGGAWTRAVDLDKTEDITRGFFVHVLGGLQNKGTLWQLGAPYPTAMSDTDAQGGTANVFFEKLVPTGNRYHAVTVRMDGIVEMRWQ